MEFMKKKKKKGKKKHTQKPVDDMTGYTKTNIRGKKKNSSR